MKKVIVFGAGRSSGALIAHLLNYSNYHSLQVTVVDRDLSLANKKVNNHPNASILSIDINDIAATDKLISDHDVVISLMPPDLHIIIAHACINNKRHLITASYLSDAIRELHDKVDNAGILFLCEMGLDPGLDHMSAMKIIDNVHLQKGNIHSFKSWCGGLVAPECDTNPWHYKISWNPKNVVCAGQATARYIRNGNNCYIPPQRIFSHIEDIQVGPYGKYEGYANRDSISYKKPYRLDNIHTLLRGTLRHEGYCHAWQALVKLGLTDDTYKVHFEKPTTYREWLMSYLPYVINLSEIENALCDFLEIAIHDDLLNKIKSLDLLSEKIIPLNDCSPADILMDRILLYWKMDESDKDLVVLLHEFIYTIDTKSYKHTSILYLKGDDAEHTAMAKTVGLPMAMATILLLENKLQLRGVHIPTHKVIYTQVLPMLEKEGIIFEEDIQLL